MTWCWSFYGAAVLASGVTGVGLLRMPTQRSCTRHKRKGQSGRALKVAACGPHMRGTAGSGSKGRGPVGHGTWRSLFPKQLELWRNAYGSGEKTGAPGGAGEEDAPGAAAPGGSSSATPAGQAPATQATPPSRLPSWRRRCAALPGGVPDSFGLVFSATAWATG